jgi:hypothetical protein
MMAPPFLGANDLQMECNKPTLKRPCRQLRGEIVVFPITAMTRDDGDPGDPFTSPAA